MSEVEQKNCCPVVISKDQIIPGTEFYDMWNVGSAPDYKAQVPIFSVYNMHGLNAIIGYVMLINSNAVFLYGLANIPIVSAAQLCSLLSRTNIGCSGEAVLLSDENVV